MINRPGDSIVCKSTKKQIPAWRTADLNSATWASNLPFGVHLCIGLYWQTADKQKREDGDQVVVLLTHLGIRYTRKKYT